MSETPVAAAEMVEGQSREDLGGARARLSVVVPVRERAAQLRRLLGSLGGQSLGRDRFEVLVCDDGSLGDLARVAGEAATEHRLRLVYLRQENRGPGPARNLGLAHAAGEIVAFIDSDCEADPGWLAALDRAFVRGVGLVGGPVGYRDAEHLSGRCVNFLMSATLGAAGARDPRCLVHMDYYPRTTNLAVRRELALAAGGFPGDAYGEDLEFSHRIRALGARPRFVPDAEVLHNERSGLGGIFLESLRKGVARVRLRRTCGMHQAIHLLPAALWLDLLMLPAAAILGPLAAVVLALPLLAYALALVALAVHGIAAIGDPRALAAVPAYAAAMHLGYGLGYLACAVGLIRERSGRDTPDWAALRSIPRVELFGIRGEGGWQAADEPRSVGQRCGTRTGPLDAPPCPGGPPEPDPRPTVAGCESGGVPASPRG